MFQAPVHGFGGAVARAGSVEVGEHVVGASLEGATEGDQFGQLSAETQALGQEVSMISQSLANSIKSIGEAATALARKG